MTKRFYSLMIVLLPVVSLAGIPAGYYDSAQGLSGESLQWALHNIIDNHTSISYNAIKTAFYTTDDRYGNKVWDMYSDVPGGTPPYLYTLGDDFSGSASGEGEGYNREHSWPKSWFNDNAPMNTDLFHIVPSDIYVNNRRSNYPYAEVGSTTWVSQNGSRLGSSVTPGYSGTAFEPIDGYKGDFARTYFYMATRYKGEDNGWAGSAMADGADLEDWAVDMLIEWHENDPVSTKETERNDAVYLIQDNRNPFIDHPEYVQYIYDPISGIEDETQLTAVCVQSSPNPFSSFTSFSYTVPMGTNGSLRLYDTSGRMICSLLEDVSCTSEANQVSWNGTDENGNQLSPGIYFAVLTTDTETSSLRMVRTGL